MFVKLASLHEESIGAAFDQKRGIGLLLAMRRWATPRIQAAPASRAAGVTGYSNQ
jgi:hypothetical protein